MYKHKYRNNRIQIYDVINKISLEYIFTNNDNRIYLLLHDFASITWNHSLPNINHNTWHGTNDYRQDISRETNTGYLAQYTTIYLWIYRLGYVH
jgi:hypothetical protein